ncbi:MAG: glucan ABC transporter ATP-binding protein/ permease [Geminicoccaceae bacterium]
MRSRLRAFVELYGRVLALLAPERRFVLLLVGANIGLALLQFVEPVLFGRVVDLLTGDNADALRDGLAVLGLWAVVGIGGIVANVVVALNADRLAHRRRLGVTARYVEHVLALPAAFHDQASSARLLKVMLQGTDRLFSLWLSFFREQLVSLVAILVLLPLTMLLNWRLGLVLNVLIVVFAALTVAILLKTERAQREVQAYQTALAARVGDAIGNVAVIQSFTRLGAEVRDVDRLMQELLRIQAPVLSWWAVVAVLTRAAATLTVLTLFALGAWLKTTGGTTVGEIMTFMGFATLLIGRLEQTLGFVKDVAFERAALEEFFAVLDTEPQVRDRPGAAVLGRVRGEVRFEHVAFAHGTRPTVIDLDFAVPPGSRVALVGRTGAGKSTAVALLYRLADPAAGRILVDGQDIRDVTLESLRRNIGVVFQQNTLFQRSIADNLRIGRPEATDAELVAAAEAAQAHEFIVARPEGYQTVLGERGAMLSGGERQRLAIARALLKDPPILILDEATSALDTATEARLQEALARLMLGRTCFIVAHRLSTVRDADLILVLEQGRIVERGTFAELSGQGGRFAELVRTQFGHPGAS